MKYRVGGDGFIAAGRPLAVAAAVSVSFALAACTTASIDDVAPVAPAVATVPQPTPRPEEPPVTEQALLPVDNDAQPSELAGGPRKTGEFPNLNVQPGAAAAQITPAEKAAMLGELRAKQAGVAAAAANAKPPDRVQNLRRLGSKHAEDALEAIEKESE
jgi:hypothetical protein